MQKNFPFENDYDFDFDEVFDLVEQGDFLVGQEYGNKPAETLKCRVCGATEFIVGAGHCFTAVKCKKCQYQVCIHDG